MWSNTADVRESVIAAVKTIDRPMLMRMSYELVYRVDVCRVTRGTYTEHL